MQLYTIGHSNHTLTTFLALLQQHHIEALADVRSQPYSRFSPHFRRMPLQAALASQQLDYHFLGAQLGGRPADRSCYRADGKVDYERLAQTPDYLLGIERLLALTAAQRIAAQRIVLMCSEASYQHCHRHHLLTRTLLARGVAVQHILPTGEIVQPTLADFATPQASLF